MMGHRRDPGNRLAAAILAHGTAAGCTPVFVTLHQRDWASATFIGLCQRLVLAIEPGLACADWLASLPEATFAIPGHYIADLVVDTAIHPDHVAIHTLLLTEA